MEILTETLSAIVAPIKVMDIDEILYSMRKLHYLSTNLIDIELDNVSYMLPDRGKTIF